MRFLIRSVEAVFQPVGIIWCCITLAAIVLWRRKQRLPALGAALLSLVLWIAGATPVAEHLIARFERPYISATVDSAPKASAVVVLGGFLNPSRHDSFGFSFNSAADRLVTGVELMRRGKSATLVVSGGPATIDGQRSSEGKRAVTLLKAWGVVPGEVLGLEGCWDTHEEAVKVSALAAERKWTNLIVVTSGFHMPRAAAVFRKAGLEIHPVACDFEGLPVVEGDLPGFRLVPTVDHLRDLTLYLHELIGWFYYSLRGWI